jgi:hypothetical protein
MTFNHLNLIEFLLYLELLFALITVMNSFIITPTLILITSILDLNSYKTDAINLYLNIPFVIIEIILIKILIDANTSNLSILVKTLYYIGGASIFIINQLIHKKSVYELAIKENNFLLKYDARKFFKLTRWLYPLLFFAIMPLSFDFTNSLTTMFFNILKWLFNLKYVGWLIPWLSYGLLIGSFSYAVFFLLHYRKLKREFDRDFYNDVLNG